MRIEIRTITPELAEEWCRQRAPNRKLRLSLVSTYAQDMTEGRWRETHQGIAFDESGRLIDGQHRLAAIIKSGVTVTMPVAWAVAENAMPDIDRHARRSIADCVSISTGASVHFTVIAVCNAMKRGIVFGSSEGRGKPLSAEQALAWLTKHETAVRFACRLIGTGRKGRGLSRADLGAVLARAHYHAPESRIASFYEIVSHPNIAMESTEAGAGSALLLNQFLLAAAGASGGAVKAQKTYAKASRALRAFLDGQRLAKLYEATEELFPLPDERGRQ